ncbi:MAG: hypothetical protein ABIQ18_40080 [Umezawaea sp.]
MEYMMLGFIVVLASAWTTRRCFHRHTERARLARIRASIDVWLTPECMDASAPDVRKAAEQDQSRRFGPGSAGYHRGRSA